MKSRVKLTTDNLKTYFAQIPCPNCGLKNVVADLEVEDVHYCDCGTPLVLRAADGQWYHIRSKVFD